MALDGIAYRTARSFVRNYQDEYTDWLAAHKEAMDCWNCQTFLQLGIDTFKWITRTDQEFRKDIYSGKKEFDPVVDQAIEQLYAEWLKPCEYAEHWIETQISHGFKIDNLEEFQRCCAEVRAIVDEIKGRLSNKAFISAQAAAIEAYRKGDTVEFWGLEESQDA
jgi:hypothetical protein